MLFKELGGVVVLVRKRIRKKVGGVNRSVGPFLTRRLNAVQNLRGRGSRLRSGDREHRRLDRHAKCFPQLVPDDQSGALFFAWILEDSRPLRQGSRAAPRSVGGLPHRDGDRLSDTDATFRQETEAAIWPTAVKKVLAKLWNKVSEYALAYAHPACRRTSNMVDRLTNRVYRILYPHRGLHGYQSTSRTSNPAESGKFQLRPTSCYC